MNETHWVAVGLIAFFALLAYLGAFKTMMAGLDKRAQGISDELAEASRLRQEAENVLADFRRRQGEAEKEAKSLIDNAKVEAERYAADAKAKMDDFVARRTKQAELKIKMAEQQAMAEVRALAADAATSAAGLLLSKSAKGTVGDELIASGIEQIKSSLN